MNDIISLSTQNSTISTLTLASYLNQEHRSVMKLIYTHKQNLNDLGKLSKCRIPTAGRPSLYHELNHKQIIFLLSTMRNTDIVNNLMVDIITKGIGNTTIQNVINLANNMDIDDESNDPHFTRYVYVAMESESGRFKIGISKHPEERIKQLNTGNPEQLILIHAYEARGIGYSDETQAHKLYENDNLRSEWFDTDINLNLLPSYNDQNLNNGNL